MAFRKEPFVWETTNTIGTIDYVLAGEVTNFRPFSVLDDADTFDVTVRMGAQFETGRGAYNSGADSISITEVYNSSNGNAKVDWGAGTKQIYIVYAAAKAVTTGDIENMLASDKDATLTAGFASTSVDDGTKSSGTYTPTYIGGNRRDIVNGGAFTLSAPNAAGDYDLLIQITNNGSAVGSLFINGNSIIATPLHVGSQNHCSLIFSQKNRARLLC